MVQRNRMGTIYEIVYLSFWLDTRAFQSIGPIVSLKLQYHDERDMFWKTAWTQAHSFHLAVRSHQHLQRLYLDYFSSFVFEFEVFCTFHSRFYCKLTLFWFLSCTIHPNKLLSVIAVSNFLIQKNYHWNARKQNHSCLTNFFNIVPSVHRESQINEIH